MRGKAEPGYDEVALRVRLFCRPDGFNAAVKRRGRISLGPNGCVVTAPATASQAVESQFDWTELVGVDRTRFGVRFRFASRSRTLVVSTRKSAHTLTDYARSHCPEGTFNDQIHSFSTWCWDPDE